MSRLKRLAREAADAALQLTLPLFDHGARTERPASGRRRVCLNGQVVDYELRRSRRRTIGFVIDDRGLSVTSPHWVPVSEIEAALTEKSRWILRKLVEWREYASRRERMTIRWREGAEIPFLGEVLRMTLAPCPPDGTGRDGALLRVALPPGSGAEQVKDAVQGWLQGEARELFAQRIDFYAERLGERPSRWGLSSARTRWGSCGPDGSIRLNWRLVHFPLEIVDYVIAHEMAHLRELNHGPRFWSTVGQLFPEFENARAWLRSYPDDMNIS